MRKVCNKNVIIYNGVFLCVIAAVWILLEIGGGFHVVVSVFHSVGSEESRGNFTSTKYRYEKEFQNTLNHYRTFSSYYNHKLSTAVPGLENTNVLGNLCDQMVPQGICVADDYMLVTAYDNGKNKARTDRKKETKVNNSVMYVLSNQNPKKRELLTTIVLPDVNHVGGIAFDGENIWIAKSTARQCSMISYDVIKKAAACGLSSYELPAYDQNVSCGAVASFLAFYNGKLWVGTYTNRISKKGTLRSYDILKKHTEQGREYELKQREELVIPGYANGAEFVEMQGKTYMAIVSSQGRYFDSKIYFYEIQQDPITGANLYYPYYFCKFPPMAEELTCEGDNMYFLFESSATCYSTPTYLKCMYPVDRICALSARELFAQNQNGAYQNSMADLLRQQFMPVFDEMYQERKYWQQYV